MTSGAKRILLGAMGFIFASAASAGIQTKTLKIYNNTPGKLYAIVEIGKHDPLDEWMQGYFQTMDVKRDTYTSTNVYRVYVNPNKGIKSGASVIINVPFWSQLVQNPDPRQPNQYIDWWNGGRVLIYDVQANLLADHNKDSKNPVTPLSESLSCTQDSDCEPLTIFASGIGLPATDPNQLTEYTFADVVTGLGPPYEVKFNRVDYDLSYVDQVYLPTAMGPVNNRHVGFTGTTQDLPGFRKVLHKFLNAWQGWPTYAGNPPYPEPRIPGAYNAFVGGDDLTDPGVTIEQMKQLWKYCNKQNDGTDLCKGIRTVNDLFQKNYAKYLTLDCDHVKLTDDLLIRHVYGWVEFNEHCGKNAFANKLKDTPGVNYPAVQNTYIQDLQYTPSGEFNPYVQLIHSPDYLAMAAYAFSIDDAVGNMNELGDGVIVAVGGSKGLENDRRFDPSKKINVNLGAPGKGGPKWKSYGICSEPDQDIDPNHTSFTIYSVEYPCKITVSDSNEKLYQFTILNEPPKPKVGRCDKSPTPDWCNAAAQNVNKDKVTGWNINTQPPS